MEEKNQHKNFRAKEMKKAKKNIFSKIVEQNFY
jgi:hypothetical protein